MYESFMQSCTLDFSLGGEEKFSYVDVQNRIKLQLYDGW
jgi:hypothetical protein